MDMVICKRHSKEIQIFFLTIFIFFSDCVWAQLPDYSHRTDSPAIKSHTDTLLNFAETDRLLRVWNAIKDSVDASLPFNVNNVKFSTHRFFVVYKTPDSEPIEYRPVMTPKCRLEQYRRKLRQLDSSDSAQGIFRSDGHTLQGIRRSLAVRQPSLVRFTWDEIPEPDKAIKEGRRLRTSENSRDIARLFEKRNNIEVSVATKVVEASPWTLSGSENIQISQLFVNNWAKGGNNSMSLSSDFRFAVKYVKDNVAWENSGTSKLGATYTSSLGMRTNDDVFDLASKYGYKASERWYYSVKNTFKTQLFGKYSNSDTAKVNPLSKFLSPAYIQFIFGMDYKRNNLSVLLSPFTSAITLVMDTANIDQTKFGVAENKRADIVNGLSITWTWRKQFTREISYNSDFEFFYQYYKKDGQKRFDWENVLELKVNRFLTTRLLLEIRYFENESSKFQIKENYNIAFTYSF